MGRVRKASPVWPAQGPFVQPPRYQSPHAVPFLTAVSSRSAGRTTRPCRRG